MSQRPRPSEVLIRGLTRSLLEIHGSGVNAAKAVGVTPSAFSKWSHGVWPSAESFDQMIDASPEFSEWLLGAAAETGSGAANVEMPEVLKSAIREKQIQELAAPAYGGELRKAAERLAEHDDRLARIERHLKIEAKASGS